jgi:uncharacterized transporter YbjL
MASPTPPTTPNTPSQQQHRTDDLRSYHAITDSIGGPSLRWKDYVFQGIVIAVFVGIGLLVGYVNRPTGPNADVSLPLMLGGGAGLIVGTLLSGGVLMVVGWIRTAKYIRERGGTK